MEFLKRFNRTSEAAAPVQADANHTCLTEQDVRRIAAEVLRQYVKRDWFGHVTIEPPREPTLTLDQVRKMSREEIMQRWDEVELALTRGE